MIPKSLTLYHVKGGRIKPDSLNQIDHPEYIGLAEKLLNLFRKGKGKTRQTLEDRVEFLMRGAPYCPIRRYRALFNLLEDRSVFNTDEDGTAWKLRIQVMDMAAQYHPLIGDAPKLPGGTDGGKVKQEIAAKLGKTWPEIEAALFIDLKDNHTMAAFDSYADARELLNRYNVAQHQALLYYCTMLQVEVTEDLKQILRYAKLAKLLHFIKERPGGGYIFQFAGRSSVRRETTKYGGAMGQFFLSLLRCKGWNMDAFIQLPKDKEKDKDKRPLHYYLSHEDRLLPCWPDDSKYDSSIEEGFAKKWGVERREGWLLNREDEILWQHQHTFTPDFSLTHTDGRRVLIEIAGFWTENYIRRKRETVAAFGVDKILMVVPEKLAEAYSDLGCRMVVYKTAILPEAVLAALGWASG